LPGAKKTRGKIRAREGHQASGHQRADETQAPIFTWKSHGNPYVIEGIGMVLHVISDLVNNHGHDGHESKKTYKMIPVTVILGDLFCSFLD
jgi:hypothetical protein